MATFGSLIVSPSLCFCPIKDPTPTAIQENNPVGSIGCCAGSKAAASSQFVTHSQPTLNAFLRKPTEQLKKAQRPPPAKAAVKPAPVQSTPACATPVVQSAHGFVMPSSPTISPPKPGEVRRDRFMMTSWSLCSSATCRQKSHGSDLSLRLVNDADTAQQVSWLQDAWDEGKLYCPLDLQAMALQDCGPLRQRVCRCPGRRQRDVEPMQSRMPLGRRPCLCQHPLSSMCPRLRRGSTSQAVQPCSTKQLRAPVRRHAVLCRRNKAQSPRSQVGSKVPQGAVLRVMGSLRASQTYQPSKLVRAA